MASIALVGGSGFIGTRLAHLLSDAGEDVTIVDAAEPPDRRFPFRRADVRDRPALREALRHAQIVYNLAAVHRDDVTPVTRYDDVNVGGARNVCAVCQDLGIDRLVFTSTVAVYGLATPDATEDSTPAPFNPYGQSKLRAEQVHLQWQSREPATRSLVIVRSAVVFGEGNRGNVHALVRQIITRRFVMIGSGGNRKSMAYVGNVSAFLARTRHLGPGTHLFNYADKPDLSMTELVATVLETLGRPPLSGFRIPCAIGYLGGLACDAVSALTGRILPISAIRVRKFCSTTTFSADRLRSTGFAPPMTLRDALVTTIRRQLTDSG